VGALAHYLEQERIPTTQISLIYEHTEAIKPPRALWVPFELGRPLGIPEDAPFQLRVLRPALKLLEAEQGPVLEEFPEDTPASAAGDSPEGDTWACPVNFTPSPAEETDQEKRASAFRQEAAELRPWYDLGRENRGRTAVADFDPETAAGILCDYLLDKGPMAGHTGMTPAVAIRLAAQDIKAFYFEALISRPDSDNPDSRAFADWFWGRTAAGRILRDIQAKCAGEDDEELRMTGQKFLVPMGH